MHQHETALPANEVLPRFDRTRKALRLGAVASVLAAGQFAEEAVSIRPENPLYQQSKTADTINVAVVDYTGTLEPETFENEVESILKQTTQAHDRYSVEHEINFDVDVLHPSGVDDFIGDSIPAAMPISPFVADVYSQKESTQYESVASVVDGETGRSMQLLPQTRYSHVVQREGDSELETAMTVSHELLHQYELGHVWRYEYGMAITDIMGRKFVDIYENSRAANYLSYDNTTNNIMGGLDVIEKNDDIYVAESTHKHEEGEPREKHEIGLTGMQLDALYRYAEGYQPLGAELIPNTDMEKEYISVQPDSGGTSYVKARYPRSLEWDENAEFDVSSGYGKIDINTLVLEPVVYEKDGVELVDYRIYLADDGDVPQMLYLEGLYEPHDTQDDSSQTVSVNGLGFMVDYESDTQTVAVKVVKDQELLGGW